MFYLRNAKGEYLRPMAYWYHGHPTFGSLSDAALFSDSQCELLLTHPLIQQNGCVREPVA